MVDVDERFRWLEGGSFLESRYRVQFGDPPVHHGVMYWGYDADAGVFRQIFFNDEGPFDEHGSRYTGVVDGNSLTFTGPARVRYRLDVDGRIAVDPDGTFAARWWLPDGASGWTPWRDVRYRRAVEPT